MQEHIMLTSSDGVNQTYITHKIEYILVIMSMVKQNIA